MSAAYETGRIETFADLAVVLAGADRPVLLVERVRALPGAKRPMVVAMGRMLAERLPGVVFRSGNAQGTDTAFAEGGVAIRRPRRKVTPWRPGSCSAKRK